ncbi:hypothetical protein KI387_035691, partial [Taxus chinensis]
YVLNKPKKRSSSNGSLLISFINNGGRCLEFINEKTREIGDKEGLEKILQQLETMNCIIAGLSIIAYLLAKIGNMTTNRTELLQILKYMIDLVTHAKKLSREEENFKVASSYFVEGSMICAARLHPKKLFSLSKSPVNAETLSSLQSRVEQDIPDLNLTSITAIKHQQPVAPMWEPVYPENAVGIEEQEHKVIKLLNLTRTNESSVVVVLHGLDGVGKTTLASAVISKLNLKYYNSIKFEVSEDTYRKEQIRRHHVAEDEVNRPMFLFIDNALVEDDITELLPENLSKCSRILVTTKNLGVMNVFKQRGLSCQEYCVEPLSGNHATTILSKGHTNLDHIKDKVKQILRICKGIPLILNIVGARLCKQGYNTDNCTQIIEALKAGSENNLSEFLVDFVYTGLQPSTQEAFLDICFFYTNHNWSRHTVECIMGAENVTFLEEVALIKSYGDRLIVPDVIRMRGCSMSQSTRIKDVQSMREAVKDERRLNKIKGIILAWNKSRYILKTRHLKAMRNSLRVLCLGEHMGVGVERRIKFKELRFLRVGGDIPFLPVNIDALDTLVVYEAPVLKNGVNLYNVRPLSDLNSFHNIFVVFCQEAENTDNEIVTWMQLPKQLRLMRATKQSKMGERTNVKQPNSMESIQNSSLEELDLREKQPSSKEGVQNSSLEDFDFDFPSFEELDLRGKQPNSREGAQNSSLEELDLGEKQPNSMESIQNSSLEELDLRELGNMQKLPNGLKQFSVLKILILDGWDGMKELPAEVCQMPSLSNLSMQDWHSLRYLPESFGELTTLKHLQLSNCLNLAELPSSFKLLTALEHLELTGMRNLKTLPDGFQHLTALKILLMDGWVTIEEFPDQISQLPSLSKFSMNDWYSLRYVPNSFGKLITLRNWDLSGCFELEELSIKGLSNLEKLGLDKATALKNLTLDGLKTMEELPEEVCGLPSLSKLCMNEWHSLECLPESFGQLKILRYLELSNCLKLEELPPSFQLLRALEHLDLRGVRNLKRLPYGFTRLSALKTLILDGWDKLEELPEQVCELPSLSKLSMHNWHSLKHLPVSFGHLTTLTHLELSNCLKLEELPSSFQLLRALEHLDLTGLKNLKKLSDGFQQLIALKILILDGCDKMEELPEQVCKLPSLNTLSMHDWNSLKCLPESFGHLARLRHLELNNCFKLEEFPSSFQQLEALEHLDLRGLKNLKALSDGFPQFTALKILRLDGWDRMEELPEQVCKLPSLSYLNMHDWRSLKCLPESFGRLTRLRHFELSNCLELKELPSSVQQLKSLEHLELRGLRNLK